MNLHDYPHVWPKMIPQLESALLRHEEALTKMANFKKKYTSVKNKAKRIEKYLVNADQETKRYLELSSLNYLRYAENKFTLVNKKLKRFREHEVKSCDRSLRLLKGPTLDPNITQWHIKNVSAHLHHVNSLLHEVSDMVRIAKGHLTKVDDMKKYLAQVRRRSRLS